MHLTWDINRLAPTTDARKANPCDNELRISSKTKLPFVCTNIPLEVHEHSSALIERNPSAFLDRSRNLIVVFWSSAFLNFSAPDSPKWLLERFRLRIDVFSLRLSHSCFEIGTVISALCECNIVICWCSCSTSTQSACQIERPTSSIPSSSRPV